MNYKKNYYDYINYVKTLNRSKKDNRYYEKHHIIPRSLGGDNSKNNLVNYLLPKGSRLRASPIVG